MTPLPILLALQYFSALGTVLPKSFLGAFSSNSRLVRALSRYFGMKFLWLMASFRCNDNSDVIPTLIITNFHLHLIQLWWRLWVIIPNLCLWRCGFCLNFGGIDPEKLYRATLTEVASDIYRKIPKISPSKYKSPNSGNAKNPPLNRPSKYRSPGACTWRIALKYKVKQSKNGKFTSSYKASPIDFETQISLRR